MNDILTEELLATIAFILADRVFPFYRAVEVITDPDIFALGQWKTIQARVRRGQEIMRIYRDSFRQLRLFASVCRTWRSALDQRWVSVYGELTQFRNLINRGAAYSPPVSTVVRTPRWYALSCLFAAWFNGEGPNMQKVTEYFEWQTVKPSNNGQYTIGTTSYTLPELKRVHQDVRTSGIIFRKNDRVMRVIRLDRMPFDGLIFATHEEASEAIYKAHRKRIHVGCP